MADGHPQRMDHPRHACPTPNLLQPDWPAPARVLARVTTRAGGHSQGVWAGLNLGDHVGDDSAHVAANRAELAGLLPAAPVWLQQVHGTRVLDLDQCLDQAAAPPVADAVITRQPGRVCAILTADCLPVLLCDAAGSVVGAVHAGWRGLAAGVLEATVAAMAAKNLLAWLGPAIGPTAFEVGPEVREAFVRHDPAAAAAFSPPHARDPERCFADLYLLARQRLLACGVSGVTGGRYCTYTAADQFYSYRRDGVTGRMASLICLQT